MTPHIVAKQQVTSTKTFFFIHHLEKNSIKKVLQLNKGIFQPEARINKILNIKDPPLSHPQLWRPEQGYPKPGTYRNPYSLRRDFNNT